MKIKIGKGTDKELAQASEYGSSNNIAMFENKASFLFKMNFVIACHHYQFQCSHPKTSRILI